MSRAGLGARMEVGMAKGGIESDGREKAPALAYQRLRSEMRWAVGKGFMLCAGLPPVASALALGCESQPDRRSGWLQWGTNPAKVGRDRAPAASPLAR